MIKTPPPDTRPAFETLMAVPNAMGEQE
jgi:hypothetical protein